MGWWWEELGPVPALSLLHSVALGEARLLFWDSVSLCVKWGIKEVEHSQKVLLHVSILITGREWLRCYDGKDFKTIFGLSRKNAS